MKRTLILITLLTSLIWADNFQILDDEIQQDPIVTYNPAITTSLSIIPGGGLFYSRHFAKGGLFLSTEVLLGTGAVARHRSYRDAFKPFQNASRSYDSLYREFSNALPDNQDTVALMSARNNRDLLEFEIEKKRIDWLNWSTWFTGVYLWNIGSALDASNQFSGVEFPEPKRAAALAAIPFSGAGQMYNGEISKGAMFASIQIGCLISAINFQRLMNDAEQYEDNLEALPDSLYHKIPDGERSDWQTKFESAQTSRTMFMWYGLFFYLFGIADATVDAHLNGFEEHFDISGAVDPVDGRISLTLSGEFGSNSTF